MKEPIVAIRVFPGDLWNRDYIWELGFLKNEEFETCNEVGHKAKITAKAKRLAKYCRHKQFTVIYSNMQEVVMI